MWTKKDCARQQKLAKTVKRYPSDLTDKEWALVRPLLPPASGEGRRRKTDLREIINALRYLIRSGCSWRMLPQEFGPWQTVYWWFRRLMRRFLFATILDVCTMLDRHRQKKTLAPSLAVLDSQSVKAHMLRIVGSMPTRRSLVENGMQQWIPTVVSCSSI